MPDVAVLDSRVFCAVFVVVGCKFRNEIYEYESNVDNRVNQVARAKG